MKLPNFLDFERFLRLKRAMGIPPNQLGSVRAIDLRPGKADSKEIKQLATEGLEVDITDVVPLEDGTLSYKDRRVLLYIRDVSQYGGQYSDPKFHFSNCAKLQEMRASLRIGRYVIASRDDGLFFLHYITNGRRTEKKLDVCQKCLSYIRFNGFNFSMPSEDRYEAVKKFSISDFFERYPKSLHTHTPAYTDKTAPTNDYSKDFSTISSRYRQQKDWRCERCAIDLSDDNLRRFLHVHHINGEKSQNHDTNLEALCVCCHSLEPMHSHMKAMLQYREFEPVWRQWCNSRIAHPRPRP